MKYIINNSAKVLLTCLLLFGCKSNNQQEKKEELDKHSYNLGVVAGFSELIAAGVKQLALSPTMTTSEMDAFMMEAGKIAAKDGVLIYRESDLIVTDLFPADIAEGLEVLLLYTGTTKDEYLSLKEEQARLQHAGEYDEKVSRDISRRFGRMLSYSPRKINRLIAQNTTYRTMADFGIQATNLFLYYKDLKKAGEFYSEILGFEIVADYEMALILRMTSDSYLILVDATKGMHSAEEPKTVALAMLTDQLEEWHTYLKNQNVEIKYPFRGKKAESAHDGFVIVDPEGYLLEIENFNQHPENERFVPLLEVNKKNSNLVTHENSVPNGLNFHSTIVWLYHKDVLAMQNFYQDVLGLEMVADQGWTKIYQVSHTGFMAIVDERRGMHTFTKTKAVNIGFILDDVTPWFEYVKTNSPFKLRDSELGIDEKERYKAFVGYGPEGYFYEFDSFFPHEDNTLFMKYLKEVKR